MTKQLVCWKCGASLANLSLPFSRTDACQSCNADVHVCRLCKFYNPKVSDHCDEPLAGQVRETDRANFCDYFSPVPGAYRDADKQKSDNARAALDAVFGAGGDSSIPGSADSARQELEKLFGVKSDDDSKKD